MTVIGLAGGSGSGKSTVAGLFSSYGILPVNADEIYHALTTRNTECLYELVCEFGQGILKPDGTLDRRALSDIVFNDRDKLQRLNTISHFHVLNEIRRIINDEREKGTCGVLVDAPLLFESGFDRECDVLVGVIADEPTRIARITARDGISVNSAKKRIDAQLSDAYVSSRVDYLIVNNGTEADLIEKVAELSRKIIK